MAQSWRVKSRSDKRPRPPLDIDSLQQLALFYVGRYATTRARLRRYLERKLNERGWNGPATPAVDDIVERMTELKYVDDEAFAVTRTASLLRRGYGVRRVRQTLRAVGIVEDDSEAALKVAEAEALEAAFRFARRRKLGPFSQEPENRLMQRKAFAAILRAGHAPDIARKVLNASASELPDWDEV